MSQIKPSTLISELNLKHKEMILEQICSYPLWQEGQLEWPNSLQTIQQLADTVGLGSEKICDRLEKLIDLSANIHSQIEGEYEKLDIRFEADTSASYSIEQHDVANLVAKCIQEEKGLAILASTEEQAYSAALYFLEKQIKKIYILSNS